MASPHRLQVAGPGVRQTRSQEPGGHRPGLDAVLRQQEPQVQHHHVQRRLGRPVRRVVVGELPRLLGPPGRRRRRRRVELVACARQARQPARDEEQARVCGLDEEREEDVRHHVGSGYVDVEGLVPGLAERELAFFPLVVVRSA